MQFFGIGFVWFLVGGDLAVWGCESECGVCVNGVSVRVRFRDTHMVIIQPYPKFFETVNTLWWVREQDYFLESCGTVKPYERLSRN